MSTYRIYRSLTSIKACCFVFLKLPFEIGKHIHLRIRGLTLELGLRFKKQFHTSLKLPLGNLPSIIGIHFSEFLCDYVKDLHIYSKYI